MQGNSKSYSAPSTQHCFQADCPVWKGLTLASPFPAFSNNSLAEQQQRIYLRPVEFCSLEYCLRSREMKIALFFISIVVCTAVCVCAEFPADSEGSQNDLR